MIPQLTPRRWVPPVLVTLMALLPYLTALGSGFVLDDRGQILRNEFVRAVDLRALLTADYWAGYGGRVSGLYRPLTSLTFALDYALWGEHPLPYHLLNLLLHVACSLLVYRVAAALLMCVGARHGRDAPAQGDRDPGARLLQAPPDRRDADWVPLVSALVFAVHPIHSEAVISIVGRADLLCSGFVLLGIRASLEGVRRENSGVAEVLWPRIAAALALGAGLLAKEQAVVLPGLALAVHGWLWRRGRLRAWPWREYALYAVVIATYLGARHQVLGGLFPAQVDVLDNPLAHLSLPWRGINALAIGMRYVALLAFPRRLSADYSLSAFPISQTFFSAETAAALVFCVGAGALALRYWHGPGWMSVAAMWFLISMAPVANVLMPIGTIMAERLLYLPSVGAALLLGRVLVLFAIRGRIAAPCVGILLLALALRTGERGLDWRDNETLFQAACAAYPRSARARQGWGEALLNRGDAIGALARFREALEIHPRFYMAHYNSGVAYLRLHQFARAAACFARAVELKPDSAPALLNLGAARQQLGQWDAAATAYTRAVAAHPQYAPAWGNLADVEWARGNREAARRAARQLLRLRPHHPRAEEYRKWERQGTTATAP